ncbi:hypothetical protein P43SY_004090 [Pythium insidiosum]|uniref:HECT-type E3 ubiquitin transferase n=1 Tax=Pythium insidiosum TaxID=114742 RepID=A0AAD5LHP9_PYTIN|nr:hypothetical protein P43SY_004090 [Pythium insidiosum]
MTTPLSEPSYIALLSVMAVLVLLACFGMFNNARQGNRMTRWYELHRPLLSKYDTVRVESLEGKTGTLVALVERHVDRDCVTQMVERTERSIKQRVEAVLEVSSCERVPCPGLAWVVPPEMLMLFDAEELDYVLSGSDEIDVEDWERNSKWTFDLEEHPVREWFWELVREMPNEHRRRLLQFCTGSSRVPLAGFSALTSYDDRLSPFTLKGIDPSQDGNIRSHACFNRLDLPRYNSK